jgi:hypothetical protein
MWESAFGHADETPAIINLQGGKVYFGSWFQRVQPMVVWPFALGLWHQSTSWWEHVGEEAYLLHGSQEAKREPGRAMSLIPLSMTHHQWPLFSSRSYHLAIPPPPTIGCSPLGDIQNPS